MKAEIVFLLAIAIVAPAGAQTSSSPSSSAQSSTNSSALTGVHSAAGTTGGPVLIQSDTTVGPDDVISLTVFDVPELTRQLRIGTDGTIRVPLLKKKIKINGMLPGEIETAIANELKAEDILVDPVVSVAVLEYHSRPVSVVGAVRMPVTFQAMPNTHLLDAITRAGGLTDVAGSDIIVTRTVSGPDGKSSVINQRIPANKLMVDADDSVNIPLYGGEEVRVPEAGRVYIIGDVRHPGAIGVHDTTGNLTVLKAIAMSDGLDSFASKKTAYIFRKEGSPDQDGVPVNVQRILNRKIPDVVLQANDILYIPDNTGKRITLRALEATIGLSSAAAAAAIYTHQ
ncbi:MAG TPA: polysaccharide biosynthesis/export family protein [Bryobacteraceae bacterium]|jgi:polysaccharide export outer membrane protein|nr:polysaccharide biosynthesis/export family protein [Bryobacteraceae bacterium]